MKTASAGYIVKELRRQGMEANVQHWTKDTGFAVVGWTDSAGRRQSREIHSEEQYREFFRQMGLK